MFIERSSWHWKVYSWWFLQTHGYPPESNPVNLCPYIRAVLFWSWMRFLGTARIVSGFFWGFLIGGTLLVLGWFNPYIGLDLWKLIGMCVVGGSLFAGFIASVFWSQEYLHPVRRVKGTSFVKLIGGYVKAVHDKVCPSIEVK